MPDPTRDPMRVTAADSLARQRRTAGGLRRRGLAEGDRVALLVPGSCDFVSAALGALRVGVVPVPTWTCRASGWWRTPVRPAPRR